MSDEAVYRTAPATPGLFNSSNEMDEGNFEADKDVDLVSNFSKLWNQFGESIFHEILNNPVDIE